MKEFRTDECMFLQRDDGDGVHMYELLQSSKTTLFKMSRVQLFGSHRRSWTAFKPTQTNHARVLNTSGFGSTGQNKAGVNAT